MTAAGVGYERVQGWVKPILGRIVLISIFLVGVAVFLVILIRGY